MFRDEHYISDVRTAAAGAVVAKALAPTTVNVAAVLATGVQAFLQALALHEVPPFSRLLVWGRDPTRAHALVERLRPELPGPRVDLARSVEEATRAADVIITTTAVEQRRHDREAHRSWCARPRGSRGRTRAPHGDRADEIRRRAVIVRVWRAVVAASRTGPALDYLRRTGVLACRTSVGNRGVLLLRREREATTDVLFLSPWESMDAVRSCASPDVDKAVSYAGDVGYLIEADTMVAHHRVDALRNGELIDDP